MYSDYSPHFHKRREDKRVYKQLEMVAKKLAALKEVQENLSADGSEQGVLPLQGDRNYHEKGQNILAAQGKQ